MQKLSLLSLALAAACSSQTAGNQTGHLQASADAQHVGVYAYAVDGDVVTLFDHDGIEMGRVAVSAPAADRRLFNIELVDGTLDDAEVYRPLDDGRFMAPVTPQTALTATLADPALAPTWAAHQVQFTINAFPRYAKQAPQPTLAPSDSCDTTSCTTPSSDTPAGCARPANTSVGCTNVSQLPPTVVYDNRVWRGTFSGYSLDACLSNGAQACVGRYGGAAKDYTIGDNSLDCVYISGDGSYEPYCNIGTSGNSWTASCPRQTCGTVGQYDAVPRKRDCTNPGSCTKSQGTVGCTPYH